MAFIPDANQVLEVTVEGSAYTEQFINKYYFVFSDPDSGPTGGTSTTFLNNFKAAFTTHVLNVMYDVYSVTRYWLRSIVNATQIIPSSPARFKPVYAINKLDWKNGGVTDIGGEALAVDAAYLPAGNALRLLKIPTTKTIGFFNKSYNRYGPFTSAQLQATLAGHDKWDTTFATAFQTALDTFHATAILDQVAGNGWYHCIWSTQYYGLKCLPTLLNTPCGVQRIANTSVEPYVGTQATRRFNPRVGFRGK